METRTLETILAEHPFFDDMKKEHLELLAGCASNVRFDSGQYLFREGESADHFYILRHGGVAVEIYDPRGGAVTLETASEGSVLGWSWLFPPYEWHFNARAIVLTRALAMDGKCLRSKCDEDFELGYRLMQRFAQVTIQTLETTRLRLLDIYR
jgi:CRP-like cAMP-binding protein